MKRVHVRASKAYDVLIEGGISARIGEYAAELRRGRRCVIVSDTNVAPLYLTPVTNALRTSGFCVDTFIVPAGEVSKSVDNYIALIGKLADSRLTRADAVIALGGGVVGDLAGFAAATYLRGVGLIQVPTTLLACVDSSVGGKTGVDLPQGKNLLGAFCQPDLVLCDPDLLHTLPGDILSDGFAEVIKYGMIGDAQLLEDLKGEPELTDVIAACVAMKRDIVERDEFDNSDRQLLNFGHTLGHAVEKLSDFTLSHGKSVAVGMSLIARAAAKRSLCDPHVENVLAELLGKYHLPAAAPFCANRIAECAAMDKKVRGGSVTLVIPDAIGHCGLKNVPIGEIIDWARDGGAI